MKAYMKPLLTLTLALFFCVCFGSAAFAADASVTYQGGAEAFIFAPGSTESPSDLFPDFKNVMPGDSLTDTIELVNDSAKKVRVRVYLKALPVSEEDEDFLSQLTLTVKQNGENILFEAPASETAQLTENVLLGTLHSGGTMTLEVSLNVPITMGNDYQEQLGKIDWQFTVEEFPEPKPPTGDTPEVLYFGLLAAVCAGGAYVLSRRRRAA